MFKVDEKRERQSKRSLFEKERENRTFNSIKLANSFSLYLKLYKTIAKVILSLFFYGNSQLSHNKKGSLSSSYFYINCFNTHTPHLEFFSCNKDL